MMIRPPSLSLPARRFNCSLTSILHSSFFLLHSPRGSFDGALGGFDPVLAVGQTFLSAGEADFPVCWIEAGGDRKVAGTGRLESLPYVTVSDAAHTQREVWQF
jgi:hypothetical protein